MKTFKPQLTNVENSVLEKINENLDFFVTNNLNVLAKNYFVGEATIIRMIKKLGFMSLKKMQLEYSNKMNIEKISQIDTTKKHQTVSDIIQETSALSIYPILETIKNLNPEELKEIVEQINNADIIVVFSSGTSNYAAQYLYNALFLIGKTIIKIDSIEQFFEFEEFQENKNLFIIIFSNSGLKRSVIQVFEDCQAHQWKTLWVGSSRSLMHNTPLLTATYKLSYRVHYAETNLFPTISALNGQIFVANLLANCVLKSLSNTLDKIQHLNQKISNWHFD